MRKISLNQQGFSLVQVMIAIGMTGFLVLVMSKLNEQGIKTQKTLEAKTDRQQWLQTIFLTQMKDSTACMRTLSQPDAQIDASKALTDLYQSDSLGGAVFFSVGDFLPSGDYQVTAMNSTGFVPNATDAIEGVCPVQFEFTVNNGSVDAGNITASQITRETINFPCTINPTNNEIVNCSTPQGVNLNSLWDLDYPTPPGTDDFASWNPQAGSGSVVVGRLSRDTVANDTASLNINLQGVDWSTDTSANLWEGLTLNPNNGFLWGNQWVLGLTNAIAVIGDTRLETNNDRMLYFNRGVSLSPNSEIHVSTWDLPIEVAGDLYSDPNGVSDGTDPYNFRVGLLTDGDNLYVDWNRIWRDYSFAGTGALSYTNPGGAEYGAFLRWNVLDARLDFYLSGSEASVADLETWHSYTIFADRRFIFSNYGVLDSPPPANPTPTWNYSYADAGSRYSFILGTEAISTGEHTMNIGENNWIDCDYCFVIGTNNTIDGDPLNTGTSDGADFSMIIGSNNSSDGYNNLTHSTGSTNNADYAFVGGSSSMAGPDADFGLAFGNQIEIFNPYEVSFGTFNATESTATDFVRFSLGDGNSALERRNLLTYYNSGTLRLSIHNEGYQQFATKPPGDLFVMAPNQYTARYDNALMLGYNLWRRCDGTNPCDYVTFGDPAVVGYSGIGLDDAEGIILIADTVTSGGNTDRTESSLGDISNITSNNKFMRFAIDGIELPDNDVYVGGDLRIQAGWGLFCDASIIDGTGDCWDETSDQRLKKEIKPLAEKGLMEKIKNIRTVSFRYIANKTRLFYGVIAQEIQKLFPDMIGKNSEGFLKVYKTHLLAIAVKGMQILTDLMNDAQESFQKIVEDLNQLEQQSVELEQQNEQLLNQYCQLSQIKREDLCQN